MRLEDANLYLAIEAEGDVEQLRKSCREAILGGVDIIGLTVPHGREEAVPAVLEVGAEEDALVVLRDVARLASGLSANGLELVSGTMSLGQARAIAGVDKIVGVVTRELNDIVLALEVGVDYVVHQAGSGCVRDFASLGMRAGVPLYAGGVSGIDEAAELVANGIYRLCVDAVLIEDGRVRETMAAYSRILGRDMGPE